jgi:hypothetical protein
MSQEQFAEQLEALMDKAGIRGTLEAMASIAAAKADHVRSNWQDESQASAWDKMSGIFSKAHFKAKQLGL